MAQKPNNFSIILTYGRCRCVLNLPNFNVRRTLNFLFEFAKSCGIPKNDRKDPDGFIPHRYHKFLISIIVPLSDFYEKYRILYEKEN